MLKKKYRTRFELQIENIKLGVSDSGYVDQNRPFLALCIISNPRFLVDFHVAAVVALNFLSAFCFLNIPGFVFDLNCFRPTKLCCIILDWLRMVQT